MSGTPFPLPDTAWPATRGFWEAATRGILAIPRCEECGTFCWYPPEHCPRCGSGSLSWTPTRGRGTLFSWAVVKRAWVKEYAAWAPYVTGLVALEEDPAVRVVSRIVDCEPSALRVEMPVQAVFRPLRFAGVPGEVAAPLFAPAP